MTAYILRLSLASMRFKNSVSRESLIYIRIYIMYIQTLHVICKCQKIYIYIYKSKTSIYLKVKLGFLPNIQKFYNKMCKKYKSEN